MRAIKEIYESKDSFIFQVEGTGEYRIEVSERENLLHVKARGLHNERFLSTVEIHGLTLYCYIQNLDELENSADKIVFSYPDERLRIVTSEKTPWQNFKKILYNRFNKKFEEYHYGK